MPRCAGRHFFSKNMHTVSDVHQHCPMLQASALAIKLNADGREFRPVPKQCMFYYYLGHTRTFQAATCWPSQMREHPQHIIQETRGAVHRTATITCRHAAHSRHRLSFTTAWSAAACHRVGYNHHCMQPHPDQGKQPPGECAPAASCYSCLSAPTAYAETPTRCWNSWVALLPKFTSTDLLSLERRALARTMLATVLNSSLASSRGLPAGSNSNNTGTMVTAQPKCLWQRVPSYCVYIVRPTLLRMCLLRSLVQQPECTQHSIDNLARCLPLHPCLSGDPPGTTVLYR